MHSQLLLNLIPKAPSLTVETWTGAFPGAEHSDKVVPVTVPTIIPMGASMPIHQSGSWGAHDSVGRSRNRDSRGVFASTKQVARMELSVEQPLPSTR